MNRKNNNNNNNKKYFTIIIYIYMDNLHFILNNIHIKFFKGLIKYKNDYQ